jgi:hypothetical protein
VTLTDLFWSALAVLVAALISFAAGRRLGWREGRRRAVAEIPIALRAQALEEGVCPTCGAAPTGMVQYGPRGS